MVKVLYGRSRLRSEEAYQSLPTPVTIPKSKGSGMRFLLPNVTGIFARGAKPIGGFGLVYQLLPLCRSGSVTIIISYYQTLPAAELNTHMISSILFYIAIVGLVAYASYLRHQLKKR